MYLRMYSMYVICMYLYVYVYMCTRVCVCVCLCVCVCGWVGVGVGVGGCMYVRSTDDYSIEVFTPSIQFTTSLALALSTSS